MPPEKPYDATPTGLVMFSPIHEWSEPGKQRLADQFIQSLVEAGLAGFILFPEGTLQAEESPVDLHRQQQRSNLSRGRHHNRGAGHRRPQRLHRSTPESSPLASPSSFGNIVEERYWRMSRELSALHRYARFVGAEQFYLILDDFLKSFESPAFILLVGFSPVDALPQYIALRHKHIFVLLGYGDVKDSELDRQLVLYRYPAEVVNLIFRIKSETLLERTQHACEQLERVGDRLDFSLRWERKWLEQRQEDLMSALKERPPRKQAAELEQSLKQLEHRLAQLVMQRAELRQMLTRALSDYQELHILWREKEQLYGKQVRPDEELGKQEVGRERAALPEQPELETWERALKELRELELRQVRVMEHLEMDRERLEWVLGERLTRETAWSEVRGRPREWDSQEQTSESLAEAQPTRRRRVPTIRLPRFRLKPKPKEVWLAAAAPPFVTLGSRFVARFGAYTEEYRSQVTTAVTAESPGAKLFLDLLACQWEPGTRVSVALAADQLHVEASPQSFVWNGKWVILRFDVSVPETVAGERIILRFDISIEGLPIARIRPELKISDKPAKDDQRLAEIKAPNKAFASYASLDRREVLGRIRSLQIFTGIDVFLDCLSIHPGEPWKARIKDEIGQRDIFWLFWSRNARESTWVEWEWRTALAARALDYIQPHPLEAPDVAPPPEELAALQFGTLYESFLSQMRSGWWSRRLTQSRRIARRVVGSPWLIALILSLTCALVYLGWLK